MGVRLTTDEKVCALFDSVTGWAFGPTFANEDEAESFLAYLSKRHDEWLALDDRPVSYKVGDPDPSIYDGGEFCQAEHEGFVCTWRPGHPGRPHIAGTGDSIVAVWS